jgi:hypothetical protein
MANPQPPDPDLARCYKLVFAENEGTKQVLGDLAKFCLLDNSTAQVGGMGMIDPYAMAINEGRRQVMLKIMAMIEVDLNILVNLAQARRNQEARIQRGL